MNIANYLLDKTDLMALHSAVFIMETVDYRNMCVAVGNISAYIGHLVFFLPYDQYHRTSGIYLS